MSTREFTWDYDKDTKALANAEQELSRLQYYSEFNHYDPEYAELTYEIARMKGVRDAAEIQDTERRRKAEKASPNFLKEPQRVLKEIKKFNDNQTKTN